VGAVGGQHSVAAGEALLFTPLADVDAPELGRTWQQPPVVEAGPLFQQCVVALPQRPDLLDEPQLHGVAVQVVRQHELNPAGLAPAPSGTAGHLADGAVNLVAQPLVMGAQTAQNGPHMRERAGRQRGVVVTVGGQHHRQDDDAAGLPGRGSQHPTDRLNDVDDAAALVGEQDAVDRGHINPFGQAPSVGHDPHRARVVFARVGQPLERACPLDSRDAAVDMAGQDPAAVGGEGASDGFREPCRLGHATVERQDPSHPMGVDRVHQGGRNERALVVIFGGLVLAGGDHQDLVVGEQTFGDRLAEGHGVRDRPEQGRVVHGHVVVAVEGERTGRHEDPFADGDPTRIKCDAELVARTTGQMVGLVADPQVEHGAAGCQRGRHHRCGVVGGENHLDLPALVLVEEPGRRHRVGGDPGVHAVPDVRVHVTGGRRCPRHVLPRRRPCSDPNTPPAR
jgi:hypothetical protein